MLPMMTVAELLTTVSKSAVSQKLRSAIWHIVRRLAMSSEA
jgi:hypothetical protein